MRKTCLTLVNASKQVALTSATTAAFVVCYRGHDQSKDQHGSGLRDNGKITHPDCNAEQDQATFIEYHEKKMNDGASEVRILFERAMEGNLTVEEAKASSRLQACCTLPRSAPSLTASPIRRYSCPHPPSPSPRMTSTERCPSLPIGTGSGISIRGEDTLVTSLAQATSPVKKSAWGASSAVSVVTASLPGSPLTPTPSAHTTPTSTTTTPRLQQKERRSSRGAKS